MQAGAPDVPDLDAVAHYLRGLQDRACTALEAHEPKARFRADHWEREGGGGGETRVLADGKVFERAGVNVSRVQGDRLPPAASAQRPELTGRSFQALGLSLVLHPRNPHAPTTHLNVRCFLAEKAGAAPLWWFGGGFDLTPYYGYEEDARHWHATARAACAAYAADAYPRFKHACDEYFYLPHRREPRGIGGIFFDDLAEGGFDRCFAFMRSVGDHFLD
ncbi:MAG: coproporphyrinogen III oxidase, partial [Nevskiales bacterium]